MKSAFFRSEIHSVQILISTLFLSLSITACNPFAGDSQIDNAFAPGIEKITVTTTGVTAVAGGGDVKISWDATPGAISYLVKRAPISSSDYVTVATIPETGLSRYTYLDTGLSNDILYHYVVVTSNYFGNAQASSDAPAFPQIPSVTVTSPSSGGWVNLSNSTSFTLSGTCVPANQTIFFSGAITDSLRCSSSNTWSKTWDLSSLPESTTPQTITLSLTDFLGQSSSTSSFDFTFKKDTIRPILTINAPIGATNWVSQSNQTAYTISGTCTTDAASQILTLKAGNLTLSPVSPALAPVCLSTGTWSTQVNASSLPESGAFSITADAQDNAGNSAPQASQTFKKDTLTIPTTLTISAPAPASFINSTTQTSLSFSGTCSDNSQSVSLSLGGSNLGTTTCIGLAWNIPSVNLTSNSTFTSAASGTTLIFTASHQNLIGNSRTTTLSLIKDTIPATVSITTPASNAVATNPGASFTVSGACSENSRTVSLTASAGGSTVGPATPTCTSGAWTTTLNLSTLGETTVTLTATHQDAALNTPGSATRTLIKDTTTPSVTLKTNGASVVSKTFPLNVSSPENLPLVQGTPAATLTFSATHATSPSSSFTSCTFETLGLSVSDPAYTTATACSSLPSITTTNSVPVTGTATYSTTPGATASATISNWTPTYQQHGTYLFKLTATDGVNPVTQSFFVTVRENFTITQLLAGYDPLSATSATGLAATVPSAPLASGASDTTWLNFAPTTSNATLAGGSGWLGTGQNSTSSVDPYRYSFNGTTEKMTLGTNLGASVTKFAINTWIKPSSPATTGSIIASNGGITGNGFALRQSVASPGKAEFIIGAQKYYSYQDLILSDAPVAYWRLGETSGTTVKDLSAYGNNGTYYNSVGLSQTGALTGDTDTAVSLNGTNQYALIPDSGPLQLSAKFTIEFWFKSANNTQTNNYILARNSNGFSPNQNAVLFGFAGAGVIELYGAGYSGTDPRPGSAMTIPDTNWHHVVYSYDGTTLKGYIDAGATASISVAKSFAMTTASLDGWYLGAANSGANFINGSLDEVSLYNYALTSTQVSNHYHTGLADSQKAVYPANAVLADKPAAYWRLGESSGTIAYDSSGNGLNGTYSGGYTLGQSGALTGDSDKSASFDGTSGEVTIASSPLTTNFGTLEAWANVTSTSMSGTFIKAGSGHTTGYAIGIGDTTTDSFGNHIIGLAEGIQYQNTGISPIIGWNQVVWVSNSNGQQIIYLNGNTTPIATFSAIINTPDSNLYIGGYNQASRYFGGKIDEVSVYTYPLSPTQIHNHYLSTAWTLCQSQTSLNSANWNLLSALYDGTTAKLFVNGQNECSVQPPSYTGGVATATVGASPTSTNFWQGALGLFNVFGTTDGVTAPATSTTLKNDFDVQANRFRATPIENIVKSGLVFSVDAANAQQGLSPFADNTCQGSSRIWFDLSTSALNGTLSNFGNGTNCTAASGWSGTGTVASPYALIFNNGTNNVKINSNITGNSTTVTLTAWLNPLTLVDDIHPFWNKGDQLASAIGYYFQINRTTGLIGMIDSAGAYWFSSLAVAANTWQHVAYTINATTGNTYLNGRAAASTGTIAAITPSADNVSYLMYNGAHYSGSGAASLSTLQIYNRVLTPAEIKQNCLAQEHRFTATPQSICAAP